MTEQNTETAPTLAAPDFVEMVRVRNAVYGELDGNDDEAHSPETPYLAAGRTLHVTAAQHVASGELVAFTELVIGADRAEATHQEDTLVLAAHRGHRLGTLA